MSTVREDYSERFLAQIRIYRAMGRHKDADRFEAALEKGWRTGKWPSRELCRVVGRNNPLRDRS